MKNSHDDMSLLDLGIHEARDLAQNGSLCRLMYLHSVFAPVVLHAAIGLFDFNDISFRSHYLPSRTVVLAIVFTVRPL